MRVERLEIFGFKSFMERLVLPLEGGITGTLTEPGALTCFCRAGGVCSPFGLPVASGFGSVPWCLCRMAGHPVRRTEPAWASCPNLTQ